MYVMPGDKYETFVSGNNCMRKKKVLYTWVDECMTLKEL